MSVQAAAALIGRHAEGRRPSARPEAQLISLLDIRDGRPGRPLVDVDHPQSETAVRPAVQLHEPDRTAQPVQLWSRHADTWGAILVQRLAEQNFTLSRRFADRYYARCRATPHLKGGVALIHSDHPLPMISNAVALT